MEGWFLKKDRSQSKHVFLDESKNEIKAQRIRLGYKHNRSAWRWDPPLTVITVKWSSQCPISRMSSCRWAGPASLNVRLSFIKAVSETPARVNVKNVLLFDFCFLKWMHVFLQLVSWVCVRCVYSPDFEIVSRITVWQCRSLWAAC